MTRISNRHSRSVSINHWISVLSHARVFLFLASLDEGQTAWLAGVHIVCIEKYALNHWFIIIESISCRTTRSFIPYAKCVHFSPIWVVASIHHSLMISQWNQWCSVRPTLLYPIINHAVYRMERGMLTSKLNYRAYIWNSSICDI